MCTVRAKLADKDILARYLFGTIQSTDCITKFLHKMAKAKMTAKAAARIQSATAKTHGGKVAKGSFAAKAQSAAAKNLKKGK